MWQVPKPEGNGGQTKRDVDQEDRAPAHVEQVQIDECAADHGADDRGQAHDWPEDRKGLLLTVVAEQLADEAKALRDHDRADRALQRAAGDEHACGRC